jgi:hypothetical protein
MNVLFWEALSPVLAGSRKLAGAPLYHDNLPVLDYAAGKVSQKDTNEVPIVAYAQST